MVGSYTNSQIPILIKVIQLSQNSQTITVLLVGGHKTAAEKLVFMPACSLFFDIPILPLAHVVGLKIAFFLDRWPKPSLITISDHLLCHDGRRWRFFFFLHLQRRKSQFVPSRILARTKTSKRTSDSVRLGPWLFGDSKLSREVASSPVTCLV